jgi:hypothetical protein
MKNKKSKKDRLIGYLFIMVMILGIIIGVSYVIYGRMNGYESPFTAKKMIFSTLSYGESLNATIAGCPNPFTNEFGFIREDSIGDLGCITTNNPPTILMNTHCQRPVDFWYCINEVN